MSAQKLAAMRARGKRKGRGILRDLGRDWLLYLMVLPPLLYFIIFKYGAMSGILVAFKDYNIFEGIMASPWNHLDSFRRIFQMNDFYRALRNTIVLNLLDLLFSFPAPILLALLLNEMRARAYKRLAQTVLYMPHFLSWVIIASIAMQLFSNSGMVNVWLRSVNLPSQAFLSRIPSWIAIYVLLGVWQSAGWGTILYLAAISGINAELYDAAMVDGAGRLRRIWHITLPGIRPTIVTLLILNMGRMLGISFDRPYALQNPMVMEAADVISTFVYRVGLGSFQYSIATAVGLFQSVVCILFLFITNFIAERLGETGVW